jgi:hypothetical protein
MRRTMLTELGAYGFAVASVAVCTLVRWLLNPILENQGLYLAFMTQKSSSSLACLTNGVHRASSAGPGTGSTFCVRLPLGNADQASATQC